MEGCLRITDVKTKLFNDSNETEILYFENFITSPTKQRSLKGGEGTCRNVISVVWGSVNQGSRISLGFTG